PLRIVQITDTHYFGDVHQKMLGVNTTASLRRVLTTISNDPIQPELVLVTGDLSQDNTIESYQHLADDLNTLKLPIYCIPGNHDNFTLMSKTLPRSHVQLTKHILLDNWQIILLNSQKVGESGGFLANEELQHLSHCLQNFPNHYSLIALHHPPQQLAEDPSNIAGSLSNGNDFWQLLANHPQVRVILFGHLHSEYSGTEDKIAFFGTPSTCVQLMPNRQSIVIDPTPPGYRWVDLYSDGQFQTGVQRV
ncbi:MAG: 3',5'-cyclic-AMP phosphodiesterase, partial [Gammaproteobacteria bacterium]